MATGNVLARVDDSKIVITWDVFGEPRALSVQIAMDPDFTSFLNTFLVPPQVKGVTLDVGGGHWYFRVGCFNGKKEYGVIEYSAIYGPAVVPVEKPPQKLSPPSFAILHYKPILEGVRFYTDRTTPCYAIMESCPSNKFNASDTTSTYSLDFGRGYFDCLGLNSRTTHSVRIACWEGNVSEFPTDRVARLEQFRAAHYVKPTASVRRDISSLGTAAAAGAALLRESREKPVMKFASHTAYMRYIASKTEAERS